MWIKELRLRSFRNYEMLDISLNKGLNIFFGDNAQGKTNLLESIYLLALSKSYRASNENELIAYGKDQASIQSRVVRDAEISLEVYLSQNQPKRLLANKKATKPNDFVGFLNVVLFIPDSLQLIKGSPSERRRFIDTEICQIDPVYRKLLLRYHKVVSQRNQLLRESEGRKSYLPLLDVWDDQMIELGSKIIQKRENTIDKLASLGQIMHRRITDSVEELSIVYSPFFGRRESCELSKIEDVKTLFGQILSQHKQDELRRGYTLVGPQRDDIEFLINGRPAKSFASQGQQRTAILACRLAEMEMMCMETGNYPVVLLDDVMSELDHQRRRFLVSILDAKAQTFITTTHLGSFTQELLDNSSVFRISGGQVSKA